MYIVVEYFIIFCYVVEESTPDPITCQSPAIPIPPGDEDVQGMNILSVYGTPFSNYILMYF